MAKKISFWAVQSKKKPTKPSFSNSHAVGTISPDCGDEETTAEIVKIG